MRIVLGGPGMLRLTAALALLAAAHAGGGAAEPGCPPAPAGRHAAFAARGPAADHGDTGSLVLVNSDAFRPLLEIHAQILRNLPKDVRAIVHVPADPDHLAAEYRRLFPDEFRCGRFELVRSDSDGNWARDFMPEAVVERNGTVSLRQFSYYGRPKAEVAAQDLARHLKLPLHTSEIYLDFGNLIFDGKGGAFSTEYVLRFNEFLHRHLDAAQIEAKIKEHLGLNRLVWLPRQPLERTGHIDMFAKLVGERTMLVADSRIPERAKMLAGVADRLRALGYEIVRLMHAEVPEAPQYVFSYTNSTIVNGTAFVPVYFDPADPGWTAAFKRYDQQALDTYRRLGFRVVPIQSTALVGFGGSVHCLTRQLPRLERQ